MEFPEPFNSLPIRAWRKHMKRHPTAYSTLAVRAWLQSRRKWRVQNSTATKIPTKANSDLAQDQSSYDGIVLKNDDGAGEPYSRPRPTSPAEAKQAEPDSGH
jgi:hypothetical protein